MEGVQRPFQQFHRGRFLRVIQNLIDVCLQDDQMSTSDILSFLQACLVRAQQTKSPAKLEHFIQIHIEPFLRWSDPYVGRILTEFQRVCPYGYLNEDVEGWPHKQRKERCHIL